ncbi:MAG: SDR family oxidoreductase [Solirubrobacterales bacterium]|nr:SDR family oxidoreductase [Solirubrobacterales bacterium]
MPVALVTGASRGIGLATSELLASRGWHVVAAARDTEDLADLSDRQLDQVGALAFNQFPHVGALAALTGKDEGRVGGFGDQAHCRIFLRNAAPVTRISISTPRTGG